MEFPTCCSTKTKFEEFVLSRKSIRKKMERVFLSSFLPLSLLASYVCKDFKIIKRFTIPPSLVLERICTSIYVPWLNEP